MIWTNHFHNTSEKFAILFIINEYKRVELYPRILERKNDTTNIVLNEAQSSVVISLHSLISGKFI